MSNFLPNLDLGELNLDGQTLKAIEQLLDYTESLIDPGQQPEAIASLYGLKNQIVQLKSQKSSSASKIISAGQSQLRQAFYTHRDAAKKISGTASYLLLFYAVECGLKSIWLSRNPKTSNANRIYQQTLLSKDGHNLDKWVETLRISPKKVGSIPSFHLASGGSSLDISKAHQAWRYGIKIKPEDEQKLVEWLENLCNWIKENIKR